MDWLGESRNVQGATSGQASGEEGQKMECTRIQNMLKS